MTGRRPVPGAEGWYEIDEYGNAYSVLRTVPKQSNVVTTSGITTVTHSTVTIKPQKLQPLQYSRYRKGYGLSINGKRVNWCKARMTAMAWLPNPDNLKYVNFIDGDTDNCHVSNLYWSPERMQAADRAPALPPNQKPSKLPPNEPSRPLHCPKCKSLTFFWCSGKQHYKCTHCRFANNNNNNNDNY